ncbi:hypothetical protein A3F65_00265 [Candidatus Saccharibacteria bacterium RIFCSPHIGHO2_12_FULL_47_16b]|nr:MAG: hypothetical protein A3F65_00265 [Candidatus Saccharibacteria bacterium RIFCSPHIGHO2_12_FULL_47_16b]
MSKTYQKAELTPILAAREAAVDTLRSAVMFEDKTWQSLRPEYRAFLVREIKEILESMGLLAEVRRDGTKLYADLGNTAKRAGKAEAYKEGAIGLLINHTFAGMARNGYIRRGMEN